MSRPTQGIQLTTTKSATERERREKERERERRERGERDRERREREKEREREKAICVNAKMGSLQNAIHTLLEDWRQTRDINLFVSRGEEEEGTKN